MNVVVVDHYDSYTWNLVHLIAGVTGTLPTVVEHDAVALDELRAYTHIVLSPGPGHPDNPADFALGKGVFELGRPVLGVCLGMQALVSAYGGEVGQIDPAHGDVARVEHDGTGVFADIPSPFDAVRYHSLAALSVPIELSVTAGTGDVVMGVAHLTERLWGLQFHPESILTEYGEQMVRNFLS
ncbi:MAG TPA: aminodeoxychorismate/anthranilate synthase component II [Nocardioidaceae bacterium]|nr:aminodeoxychorismate/anthranilate synthase component II [Nocardioidaceae bacterium]